MVLLGCTFNILQYQHSGKPMFAHAVGTTVNGKIITFFFTLKPSQGASISDPEFMPGVDWLGNPNE